MMEGLSFISERSAEGLVVIGDVGGIGKNREFDRSCGDLKLSVLS